MKRCVGFVALCLVLGGCQAPSADVSSYKLDANRTQKTDVTQGQVWEGEFESECSETFLNGVQKFQTSVFRFNPNHTVSIRSTYFYDGSCQIPLGAGQEEALLMIDSNQNLASFSFTRAELKLLSEPAALEFWSVNYCGITDWQANSWKVILQTPCFESLQIKHFSWQDQGGKLKLSSCNAELEGEHCETINLKRLK